MISVNKDHFIRYRNNKKRDLTYILGATCKDGIILVSDSQILRDNNEEKGDKIFQAMPNAVIGAAGITGVFLKFLKQVAEHVESKQIKSLDELINVVEDLSLHLNERYKDRVHGDSLEILMAIKNSQNTAELYHVTSTGISEEITTFLAIGHGEPYGSLFLKTAWHSGKTMRETAVLAKTIIYTIFMQGMDKSVDSVAQIWYIPFDGDIHMASEEDSEKIRIEAIESYEKLTSFLNGFISKQKQTK